MMFSFQYTTRVLSLVVLVSALASNGFAQNDLDNLPPLTGEERVRRDQDLERARILQLEADMLESPDFFGRLGLWVSEYFYNKHGEDLPEDLKNIIEQQLMPAMRERAEERRQQARELIDRWVMKPKPLKSMVHNPLDARQKACSILHETETAAHQRCLNEQADAAYSVSFCEIIMNVAESFYVGDNPCQRGATYGGGVCAGLNDYPEKLARCCIGGSDRACGYVRTWPN